MTTHGFGRRPPGRWRHIRALTGAALALLAATAFAPAFGRDAGEALLEPRFAGIIGAAVAIVTGTCLLLAATTRVAPVTRVALAVTGLAAYDLLVVAPGNDLVDGPRRLLTTAFPIEPEGAELGTVVLVIGLATLGAVEAALRRRAGLLPLVAPLAATVAGLAITASAGPPVWWLAPALTTGTGLLLVTARLGRATVTAERTTPIRRVWYAATVTGIAVSVLAVAGVLGPALSEAGRAEPADAQDLVSEPVRPRQLVTPLQLFPALRSGRQSMNLEVRSDRWPARLRYATLDRFDGQYWTRDTEYRRAGKRLPIPQTSGRVDTWQERIRVIEPGPLGWLLSSGRPVEVSVSDLGVDHATGDVVLPDDQPIPGEYAVRSVLPDPTLDELESATPASPERTGETIATPELVGAARRAVGDAYGYPALVALERFFVEGDYLVDESPEAPAGHGLFQIRQMLTSKRGTAEQYASGYAVLARALGYDARLVVGFRPGPKIRGMYPVTGQHVHAWAEVRFDGLGWIAFDATPRRTTDDPTPRTPSPTPTPTPEPTSKPSTPGQTPSASPPPCCDSSAPPGGGSRILVDAVTAVLGLVGLVLLATVLVPLLKAGRRRHARTLTDPDRRTVAAWRDVLDCLAEIGLATPASHTSGQVIAATAGRFGSTAGASLAPLAQLRDEAVYGPLPVSATAADAAWHHADGARRTIRDSLSRLARWRAMLDPKPLIRARRGRSR